MLQLATTLERVILRNIYPDGRVSNTHPGGLSQRDNLSEDSTRSSHRAKNPETNPM